jgi:hypothetical protein
MGAFYLYSKKAPVLIERARDVFIRQGFANPREFDLGDSRILLYEKQIAQDDNMVKDDQGALYVVGTPVYRGLGYRDSLKRLLGDLNTDRLDINELRGAYCLIHHRDNQLKLYVDPMGLYHVFFDESRQAISSSHLAMLAAAPKRLPINRLALLERLTTGLILGPETIAEGMFVYTPAIHHDLEGKWYSFKNLRAGYSPPGAMEGCGGNQEECADYQLEHLRLYYQDVQALASEMGVEIGLSGGYDTRLIFLLSKELEPIIPSVHSHWTNANDVPNVEIAKKVAASRGLEVDVTRTPEMENLNEELILKALSDSVHFFDGRNNNNMGFNSRLFTREYRSEVYGEKKLILSGLNGEIYRNHYRVNHQMVDFVYWMYHKLFYPGATLSFSDPSLLRELTDRMVAKTARLLRRTLPRKAERGVYRRHLGEIRAPFYSAAKINANMKLGHYLSPFAEYDTTLMAYRATPYIRSYGGFEALMHQRLDPKVANIPSHYGFVPINEPTSRKMERMSRAMIPMRLHLMRKDGSVRRGNVSWAHYNMVYSKSDKIPQLLEMMRDLFPSIEFDKCIWHPEMLANAIFNMAVLDEYSDSFSI